MYEKRYGSLIYLESFFKWGYKPNVMINTDGQHEKLTCFKRDDKTEADRSCVVNWRNEYHVFGSYKERRQISKLSGLNLKRIGELAFDHYRGACSVMNNQFIFLCFNTDRDRKDTKRCRRATGPLGTFSEVASTNHDHRSILTSSSDCKLHFFITFHLYF